MIWARTERVARVDQLVAGGHDRDPRPGWTATALRPTDGACRPPPGPAPGPAPAPRCRRGRPRRPRARTGPVLAEPDEHGVALDGGLLDRDDIVGPRRQGAAGHADVAAAAPGSTVLSAGPGEHLAGDPEGDRGGLLAPARSAPRTAKPSMAELGERRQVLGRGHLGGQDAAEGGAQPHLPDREGTQPLQHARPSPRRTAPGRVGSAVGRELGRHVRMRASPAPAPPPVGPGSATNRRRKPTKAGPMSSRAASSTVARR